MKNFAKLILLASLLLINTVSIANPSQFSESQMRQIKIIVHNYLIQNPEILVQVSNALRQKRIQQMQKQTDTSVMKYRKQLLDIKGKPTAGNINANVMLVEFFDYQCQHCKLMASVIHQLLKNNKNLKISFIELPIFRRYPHIGVFSEYASRAALAAVKQNRYYDFHNKLLLTKAFPLTKEQTMKIAVESGLNIKQLKHDMKSPDITKQINDNFALASNLKIPGTPFFIIINSKTNDFRNTSGQPSLAKLQSLVDAVK